MIGNNQLCSLCSSEVSIEGCICDDEIIFLGIQCLSDHFYDRTKDHNSVGLELALRMQAEPSLINYYLEGRVKILELLQALRKQSVKAKRVSLQYSEYKEKLIFHIDKMLYGPVREIEEISQDIKDKTKIINIYKATLSTEVRDLVERYKRLWIEGIVKNTLDSLNIPIDEILEYLTNTFILKRSSPNSSIIAEKDNIIEDLKSKLAENDKR